MPKACCDTNDDGNPQCDGTCVHRHACPDWDYLVIDDSDPEYEMCLCAQHGGQRHPGARMDAHFGINAKTNPGMGD